MPEQAAVGRRLHADRAVEVGAEAADLPAGRVVGLHPALDVVGEEVVAGILAGERALGVERAAGDRRGILLAGVVGVGVERVGVGGVAGVSLGAGPAVVLAGLDAVHLFPKGLADVVGVEQAGGGVRCAGVGVSQAVGVDLAALAGLVDEGVVGGDRAVGIEAQDLAAKAVEVLGVAGDAAGLGVERLVAVAGAEVDLAVEAELQQAADVVAGVAGDVVQQDRLAGGQGVVVIVGIDPEPAQAVDRGVGGSVGVGGVAGGVVEVEEAVGGEAWVEDDGVEAAIAVGVDGEGQERRGMQRAVGVKADVARLLGDEYVAAGGNGEVGRLVEPAEEAGFLKARRQRGGEEGALLQVLHGVIRRARNGPTAPAPAILAQAERGGDVAAEASAGSMRRGRGRTAARSTKQFRHLPSFCPQAGRWHEPTDTVDNQSNRIASKSRLRFRPPPRSRANRFSPDPHDAEWPPADWFTRRRLGRTRNCAGDPETRGQPLPTHAVDRLGQGRSSNPLWDDLQNLRLRGKRELRRKRKI